MKTLITFSLLIIANVCIADTTLIGSWNDKTAPFAYKYEFLKNNDFIYTYTANAHSISKMEVFENKGVWELGSWIIKNKETEKKMGACNLTIYAGTDSCCFEFRFIANNLILTNKFSSGSYKPQMCKNRVLIRELKN